MNGQIGCTQPRRIAALSVSRRIAEELSVTWGDEVGCKIRFTDKSKRHTRIKVMTDGILLAETRSDPHLKAYEALIIDEAHERSLNIDFLLGYLKQLLVKRPDLKVIITSATIDTELFSKAFGGAPIFEVSGRLYPVEVRYSPLVSEEDPDEISYVDGAIQAVESVLEESYDGDVLVFMPTERDIREACDRLSGRLGKSTEVLPLMGSLSAGEQERVFRLSDARKVIVATNIAETSLTIPRIRYVIDTGLARVSRYNGRQRTKRLPIEKIAKSSANQRAGRAGRVQEGVCVRLYDESDFEERSAFTDPEILRANLAEVILRMKAFKLGDVENFPFLNPPDGRAIRSGYALLHELGALDEKKELTHLGGELARLPVDPTIGRILLQSRREHIVSEALVIAAALSIQDPRERPVDKREKAEEAHRRFAHPDSDFLTLLNLWQSYKAQWETTKSQSQVRKYCKAHFLSYMRMREWGDLISELEGAMDTKVGDVALASSIKRFDGRYRAIHRAVLSGFIGQIAYRSERNTYRAAAGKVLTIFPGSALLEKQTSRDVPQRGKPKRGRKPEQEEWVVSGEIVETSRLFARMVARIQVPWVEEIGKHLCNRTYEEPLWNQERGEVVARERISLYGMPLAYRRINYSRHNPHEAAQIFIRNTLTGESSPFEYPFIEHNRKVADKVSTLLARGGRLDRNALEDRLVDFYLERFPGVSSTAEFKRCVEKDCNANPSSLEVSQDYLAAGERLVDDTQAFPDTIEIAGTQVALHYRYEPRGERDGVTLALPLALARRIPARMLDGAIPGLRDQQISYLIHSLPKEYRKQIDNIPSVTQTIARHRLLQDMPLLEAIVTIMREEYNLKIPKELFSLDALPDHLKPRIEVRTEKGVVGSGRDLSRVLESVAETKADAKSSDGGAWRELRRTWEKEEVTSWDFGDLPEAIEVTKVSGVPVNLYPTLRCEGERVALRLLDDKATAVRESHVGIRALAQRLMSREVQELKKQSKEVDAFKQLLVLYCNPDQMKEHVVQGALNRLFEGEPRYPLVEREFVELVTTAKSRMPNLLSSILAVVKTCLQLRRSLLDVKRPYSTMREDLESLLPVNFPAITPYEQLHHLPRFLKGMVVRCDRADNDPQRYHQRVEQLLPYMKLLREQSSKIPSSFRWMVEEFKISLFAQELGTTYPVSAARLDKWLAAHKGDSLSI